MKLLLINLFLFYTSSSIAQEILNERTFIKDGKQIRLVTTGRGEGSPIPGMLTPGHETHKIRLQDSINKSDFNVKYYLEEYSNNNVQSEDKALHSSFRSTYINEIIINRLTNDHLSIFMQTPSLTWAYYIEPKENSSFKLKIFTETPFEKNVPVFLIYSENPDSDTLEQNIGRLFESSSFKNLKDKDKIVEQIKTITDNFYLLLYDVIIKK